MNAHVLMISAGTSVPLLVHAIIHSTNRVAADTGQDIELIFT